MATKLECRVCGFVGKALGGMCTHLITKHGFHWSTKYGLKKWKYRKRKWNIFEKFIKGYKPPEAEKRL